MSENINNLLLVYKEWHEQSMAPYQSRNPLGYVFSLLTPENPLENGT